VAHDLHTPALPEQISYKEDNVSGNRAASDQSDCPVEAGFENDENCQPADFAINAKVRQLLNRRWVNLAGLEVGTSDGAVFLRGQLEREPGGSVESETPMARDRFLHRLRNEIKAISGVLEVVMDIDETERTDIPWRGTRD